MSSVLGYKGAFGLQKEVAFKGTVTGSIVWEKLTSHNPAGANNYYRPDYIDNSFNRSEGVMGAYSFSGDLGADCRSSDFFGMVLQGVMGSSTFTGTITGASATITAIPHFVYSQAQTLDSYRGVYKIGDSGLKQNIRGLKFESLNITGQKESALTYTANYQAGYDEKRTATVTVTLPSQDPFMFYQLSITVDGSSSDCIEGFNFTLNNNLETIRCLEIARKREAKLIERTGKVDLSLSLDTNFADLSNYQEFWGSATAVNPEEEGHRYSITIYAEGFKYQASPEIRYRFKLILPACEINSAPIPQGTGRVMETLDLTPIKAVDKSYAVSMELWNLRSTAY